MDYFISGPLLVRAREIQDELEKVKKAVLFNFVQYKNEFIFMYREYESLLTKLLK